MPTSQRFQVGPSRTKIICRLIDHEPPRLRTGGCPPNIAFRPPTYVHFPAREVSCCQEKGHMIRLQASPSGIFGHSITLFCLLYFALGFPPAGLTENLVTTLRRPAPSSVGIVQSLPEASSSESPERTANQLL
jgi:hypothetical protein